MGFLSLIPGGGILSALGWFVKSPVGRAILGIVAVLIFLGWFYHWAESHGRAAIEAEDLREQLRITQQQQAATVSALQDATQLAEQRNEFLQTQAAQLGMLQTELAKAGAVPAGQISTSTVCLPKGVTDAIRAIPRRRASHH